MKRLLVLLCCLILISARYAQEYVFSVPVSWPKPYYDLKQVNFTDEKILLGRALFYDPILSRNNTISCASCHSQYTAFTHVDHALSHGIDDRIGTRNSPALMNLAWQPLLMWDGAVNHIDVQALAPIHNTLEMDESITKVVRKLQANRLYPQQFYKAFGDSLITGEHTLKAIAQYMLTLVSCNAKYDSVMRKQSVFTVQEQNGYRLFKQYCASCHTEPLFTSNQFKNNGLAVDTTLNDSGRYTVTKRKEDLYTFKVPTLRNIEFSYPYMHDGRFKRLSEVLKYYTMDIRQSPTLAKELRHPVVLTPNEKVDMVAFLLTLTDRSFLFNPDYSYPRDFFSGKTRD
jgi:cytochrome c peroxidase